MWDQDIEKINSIFSDIESNGRRFLSNISKEKYDQENIKILSRFLDNIEFFQNNILSFSDLLSDQYVYDLISNDLGSIAGEFRGTINLTNLFDAELNRVIDSLNAAARKMHDVLRDLKMMQAFYFNINEKIAPIVDHALFEVKEKVGQMDNVLLAIETAATDKIYKDAANHYGKLAWDYEFAFYFTLTISIILFFISLFIPDLTKDSDVILYVKYFLIKFVLLATTITLCTIFGRKGAHFRKLQDQAYQTHLELNAFPLHINRLPPEDKNFLIKELALKYFGKEIDQTQHDKIGDLMKDQLAAGTELIKASAEMVKGVKSSGASESSEPK